MAAHPYKRYNLHVLVLIAAYVLVMFGLWPLAQQTGAEWLKILLAASPALCILYGLARIVVSRCCTGTWNVLGC